MTTSPTREQLAALLFSDPATEAWEGDALKILERAKAEGDTHHEENAHLGPDAFAVEELINVVGSETDSFSLADVTEGDDAKDDLLSLACSAKRGALLLLHAAFAAEQAAKGAK